MNTGIGDAINLAWKFAAVLSQRAPATLLETYEPERIAFARRLVATTDRVFTGVTSGTLIARWLRLRVAPVMIPFFFKFKMARRFMFRTLSQTSVNYRNSSLSQGHAGPVHGGDRLPWSRANSPDGSDNFKPLTSLDWQVHLYGIATPEIQKMCSQRRLSLHVFDWRADTAEVSLVRDALYLVRPDGYVALADPLARAATLASYLDARGLRPGIVSQNTSAHDARAQ